MLTFGAASPSGAGPCEEIAAMRIQWSKVAFGIVSSSTLATAFPGTPPSPQALRASAERARAKRAARPVRGMRPRRASTFFIPSSGKRSVLRTVLSGFLRDRQKDVRGADNGWESLLRIVGNTNRDLRPPRLVQRL